MEKPRSSRPVAAAVAALLVVALALGQLAKHAPRQASHPDDHWLYGITVDDTWYDEVEVGAVVVAIEDMPVRPTVRIVMSKEISAKEYRPLFAQIHEVAYVMACPVDSWDMGAYDSEQAYLARFEEAYRELSRYTDLWEVGNEINGVEWIGQDPGLIVSKVAAANAYIRAQGGRTTLTLYYPGPGEQDLFSWVSEFVPVSLAGGVDYALLSYYEDDHDGYVPSWEPVFRALEEAFPGAYVGFGECGNTAADATDETRLKMVRSYYGARPPSERYAGGCFWWTWVQDCVPHEERKTYDEINRLMLGAHGEE